MAEHHGCPGDCGAKVPRRQVACKPCWFRLPGELRGRISHAYRFRSQNPERHRQILAVALQRYRDNPAGRR